MTAVSYCGTGTTFNVSSDECEVNSDECQVAGASFCNTGTTFNTVTNQCEISCSSDRRMLSASLDAVPALDPPPLAASPAPQDVEELLYPSVASGTSKTNPPELIDDAAVAYLVKRASAINPKLLDRLADQLFGQPALA